MAQIGTVIDGKYHILKEIGRGGMSTVYLAMDNRLNKTWTVKEIRNTNSTRKDQFIIQSLVVEANLMKRLDHPAIPRIVDIIDTGSTLYVIMDYIEGVSLEEIIRNDGPQQEDSVIDWCKQVCEALLYLHNQKPPIIYRDVKPANIILKPDGIIKIIDFGIAREFKQDWNSDTTVLGTKGYAPPEQYVGQTDQRSDIYALGMTMHYLLTGVEPRAGEPRQAVRQLNPTLSEGIEAIIDKCVETNPEYRFQSCVDLLYALNNLKYAAWKYGKRKKKLLAFFTERFTQKRSPSQDPLPAISIERLNQLAAALQQQFDRHQFAILSTYLRYCDISNLDQIPWEKVSHLHIISLPQRNDLDSSQEYMPRFGGYCNSNNTWIMLVGVERSKIAEYLARCSTWLETLDIWQTGLQHLEVSQLMGLRKLRVRNNPEMTHINGISELAFLNDLDLSRSPVEMGLDLTKCRSLQTIDVSYTKISTIYAGIPLQYLTGFTAESSCLADISFLQDSQALTHLNLSRCPISALPALNGLSSLEHLDLSHTGITELPSMDRLDKLEKLYCNHTPLAAVPDVELSPNLRALYIGDTQLSEIPSGIKELTQLDYLDLSDLRLQTIPNWLIDIAQYFTFAEERSVLWSDYSTGLLEEVTSPLIDDEHEETPLLVDDEYDGVSLLDDNPLSAYPSQTNHGRQHTGTTEINLRNTQIAGVDTSIFQQPMHIIRQWFEERKRLEADPLSRESEPMLSEIKVVFLGDGEAGKSLTIARLMNEGAPPHYFDGNATPGIAIRDIPYNLNGRNILVHFWDFGGQEILHSMHRMFLTQRTLYVIFLNARDDTQDERARYWLHNVKSFADGAPVLLVLNKIDQNSKASLNERDLRAVYPNLTEAVRLSALEYSTEEFNQAFTAALTRQLKHFEMLDSPFLPAWSRLKNKLRNMQTPYIRSLEYLQFCDECGIASDDETRISLLKWFSDLGVSFHYSGSAKLEDYVILRPDWITNAIYILLYNPIDGLKNGIVPHESIYRMLQSGNGIKCVLPTAKYTVQDTEYVLNVIRRFRLSYLLDDNVEFVPMLCLRDTMPVAEDYAADPDVLEYRMIYEYLPNNVIHRLMVDSRRELDVDNVWLTGARLAQKATGLSAVVKAEGNVLRILAKSTESRCPASIYLDILKGMVEQISRDMGLTIQEQQIAYKADGLVEYFDYEQLVGMQAAGGTSFYSKRRKQFLPIAQILSRSSVDPDREKLIQSIELACQQMQANSTYWGANENDRNTFIRDHLRGKGYIVADQSLSGISAGGKLPGELDLDIRKRQDIPWTIFEGLNLKSASASQRTYWEDHLDKLLDNYNENGLPFLLLVSYITCPRDRFLDICNAYVSHMQQPRPGQYILQNTVPISSTSHHEGNHFLKMFKCTYECGGFLTTVYKLFVRMEERRN